MKKLLIASLALSSILFSKEVTVSILPQKYFVEKIAKDKIDINVMVKPGASPATYEPKPSQMRKLSKSMAYFSIGVPFEKVWLEKLQAANKKIILVKTQEGIEKIQMLPHTHHDEEEHDEHKSHEDKHHDHEEHKHEKHHEHHDKHDEHKHAHHDEHKHEKHEKHAKHHDNEEHDEHNDHDEHEGHVHTGLDPHIWLDPVLVKKQASSIYKTLVKIDSENKDFYKTNYENFIKQLDILDNKLANILKPYKGKSFMIFHPAWGYFAKRYNLEQIAVEVHGKEPKPAQLVELVKEAKLHNIKIVFVSPQFSQKGAKTISKSIKGNVAIMNPLALEWDENLLKVANDIANTYK